MIVGHVPKKTVKVTAIQVPALIMPAQEEEEVILLINTAYHILGLCSRLKNHDLP
jgi:hypothetical protein